jgi:hypothetical protein
MACRTISLHHGVVAGHGLDVRRQIGGVVSRTSGDQSVVAGT